MGYADKTLECVECGTSFTFTASEQEFFATKGYTNEPKRCPQCRQANKQRRGGSFGSYDGSGSQRQIFTPAVAPAPRPNPTPLSSIRAHPW